jgi:hypothetical protein
MTAKQLPIPLSCKLAQFLRLSLFHKWGPNVEHEVMHTSKPGAKEPFSHTCKGIKRYCIHCGKNGEIMWSSECPVWKKGQY